MLKKLMLDGLTADLAAVRSLLEQAREHQDYVGELQLQSRAESIEAELAEMREIEQESASVGIFFGGQPVIGSKGIEANFAGKALAAYQDLISKRFANLELGALGARGPVPIRAETRLMVTDVARGSFGFVLEEASQNEQLVESSLKMVVAEATSFIRQLASPDQAEFEQAAGDLDVRILSSARAFFRELDDAQATLRLVEHEHDVELSRADIQRARARADQLEIDDDSIEFTGRLVGLLPVHRRFEFILRGTGEVISGSVARDVSRGFLDAAQAGFDNPINRDWVARFRRKEVRARNQEPRRYFTLLALLREARPEDN